MKMPPVKFGLFKTRSRDHQEQPSTENLLNTSYSTELVASPSSPIPSTSKGLTHADRTSADFSIYNQDSDDDISQIATPVHRVIECSILDQAQIDYYHLENQQSTDATSISILNDSDQNSDTIVNQTDLDDVSTSYDAISLQFDETSITASEGLSVYCGTKKKNKKTRSKEEKQLRDLDMWQASDYEVMHNLLNRSGTLDEQIKWEAIATARGLCTLKDNCTCDDCTRTKYLAGVADGDAGLGAAPLFNAISVGCQVQ